MISKDHLDFLVSLFPFVFIGYSSLFIPELIIAIFTVLLSLAILHVVKDQIKFVSIFLGGLFIPGLHIVLAIRKFPEMTLGYKHLLIILLYLISASIIAVIIARFIPKKATDEDSGEIQIDHFTEMVYYTLFAFSALGVLAIPISLIILGFPF